jgi:hypothetical protein
MASIVRRGFFALLFAVPILLLTLIGNLTILLKSGSPDDPLGYTRSSAGRSLDAA